MDNLGNVPDWANPDYKRRRTLYILLGIAIAAISVGLVFLFTHCG